jgi:hypothetical protein
METFLLVVLGLLVVLVLLGLLTATTLVLLLRRLVRRLRGSPTYSRVARAATLARPMVAYRDALRRAPSRATQLTYRVQRKAVALEAISSHLGPEQRFRVVETTRRYLPDTLEAFRLVVAGSDGRPPPEASRLLVGQLSQLEASLDGIAVGAGETGLEALRANGLFLSAISGSANDRQPDGPKDESRPPAGEPT